ncbi:RNA polymerase sigma factor [Demequina globuliformis]|uniref:RNA polymerase sigma factor n=1 Tax=Demequina globuliformis TaxID=676202 RepID=UPI000785B418|nr:SigE family RNA polymerase sigma factor [Demequina globuliformis]
MSAWARTLDTLMQQRASTLFGYAYVLTGNADEAEDLLQDALVRTFRKARRVGTVNEAHAYVKRAIGTAFIDRHRRQQSRPQRHGSDQGDFSRASAHSDDHSTAVAQQLDLHEAILRLPPRQRACVVLRYLEDMPVAAVAEELGLATGTVKRYLADAVATLRTQVADVDFTAGAAPPTVPVTTYSRGGQS